MTDVHPPVRIQRFRELMREAGVEEIVEETLRIFVAESGKRLDRLADAVERSDAQTIEMEAHALRSASLNIWAEGLAGHLGEAENAATAGDVEEARRRLGTIRTEFDRVTAFIEAELGPRP